jgi:RHS repeat-associated protein
MRLAFHIAAAVKLLLVLTIAAGLANVAYAQEVTISQLKAQAPRATENIVTLGQDLMGDRVNLYNGSLEFVHTDVSLRGNDALPVAFVRRHTTGRDPLIRGALADWDIDAPYIGGTFTASSGWVNGAGQANRCSQFTAPPSFASGGVSQWAAEEFWQGHQLHVPEVGTQEILVRSSSNTTAPQDGQSWPLVTRDHWQIRCLPALQNGVGEGFVARSPQGLEYRFDWVATRAVPWLQDGTGFTLMRVEVRLMATRVSDRFGNFVNYTYSSSAPWLLTQVQASDGRVLAIGYGSVGGASRVSSVSDGTRTWNYAYSTQGDLERVTLPDGSRWTFGLRGLVYPFPNQLGQGATCDFPGAYPSNTTLSGTITHPSGATGTFNTSYRLHGRTAVQRVCIQKVACSVPGGNSNATRLPPGVQGSSARGPITLRTSANAESTQSCTSVAEYPRWPRESWIQSLTSKTISGPALSPLTWAYSYLPSPGSWAPCAGCTGTKLVDVTDPRGFVTRHTFGNTFQVNDGQLLLTQEGWNGSSAVRSTSQRYASTGPWPEPMGWSVSESFEYLSSRLRPVDQRATQLDGVSFIWSASSFDGRARPLVVTRSSTLGYTRTETTAWYDHPLSWTLGQVSSVTESSTGAVVVANTFDGNNAKLLSTSRFGRLQHTNTWYSNGLLHTQRDAANKTTTLSNYFRGIPQLVTFADGSTQNATVNNIGRVTSLTDELGFTTGFGFDPMGRLNRVSYPSGDAVAWSDTTFSVEQVPFEEYGVPAGHWRQTEANGNARRITYYDALWRPRLTRVFDLTDESNTRSMVLSHFDHANRPTFQSYVQRSIASVSASPPGAMVSYDPIGRPLVEQSDSELGLLTTTHSYLAGFQHRVTNPRGFATTSSFQAFDEPSTGLPVTIAHPENVSVSIVRDIFGKARSITRGGPFSGGSTSVTRTYVYDSNQLLCKTIEPEGGATVQDYDGAGNIAWLARGLALPSAASCDRSSAPASRRIVYGYDARDRVTSETFGDGSPGIVRSWWADGKPRTISSAGSTWTLEYNRRRLPTSEALTFSGLNYVIGWGYSSSGALATISYPLGGPLIALNPDALGRPRQFGSVAGGVVHHPDGRVAGYSYANGVSFSESLNLRNLPLSASHGALVNDRYTYDANGNPTSIIDQAQAITNRTMGYDGLDRLVQANSPNVWGSGSFGYDSVDNLRSSVVGGRSSTHSYDGNNRLSSISNGSGTTVYGHDLQGNVSQRGTRSFSFDIGNRMASASGAATYSYDGLGRRIRSVHSDGTTRTFVYSQSGQLMTSTRSGGPLPASTTHHGWLGGRLIVEQDSVNGVEFVHTDGLGSPVARSSSSGALISRTRWEPYGAVAAGVSPERVGYTGHVNDGETGLVYMQQRYYDPIAGRFLSVDPVTTDPRTGDHFNRYFYAENSPYVFIDPDGRAPVREDMGAGSGRAGLGARSLDGTPVRHSVAESRANLDAAREAIGLSQNAAAREAKRKVGIPTSQQPVSQTSGKVTDARTGEQVSVGRQQTYEVPNPGGGTQTMSVQVSRDTQGAHKDMTQIEAGKVKPGGQTDAAGRPRIQNEDKVRVDFQPGKN